MGKLGTFSRCEDVIAAFPEGAAVWKGSTAVVTGSSAGIGEEAAFHLATLGVHVVLGVRNVEKGESAAAAFRKRAGDAELRLTVLRLDVSDLDSVAAFLAAFKAAELPPLRLLVNNAGMFPTDVDKVSKQGVELTFATNHLGHFALTNGLLPALRQNAPSRVVVVSSHSHYHVGCDLSSVDALRKTVAEPKPASKFAALPSTVSTYGDSKLFNVLHAQELAEREAAHGVTVSSLHPGSLITTSLVNDHSVLVRFFWNYVAAWFTKNPNQGASTTLYAALAPAAEVHGKYLSSCASVTPSKLATKDAQARAWELSEALVQRS
eukprot:TRINITY_DN10447_c0_g1_i1.p1 TRINITY_DN10447_c0_g1~~TRINITY_DN10447_c0_g1_i1.p1  ORF type:complete len:321 (+),score=114.40 TRINITY_DN10447_c0_g1_i1:92-1054(+)